MIFLASLDWKEKLQEDVAKKTKNFVHDGSRTLPYRILADVDMQKLTHQVISSIELINSGQFEYVDINTCKSAIDCGDIEYVFFATLHTSLLNNRLKIRFDQKADRGKIQIIFTKGWNERVDFIKERLFEIEQMNEKIECVLRELPILYRQWMNENEL